MAMTKRGSFEIASSEDWGKEKQIAASTGRKTFKKSAKVLKKEEQPQK
jgi:hypothetical protein